MNDEQSEAVRDLIERYHDRFSAGDIESVLELWHEQGTVFEPGSQRATGKQQLRAAYERGYTGSDYHFVPSIEDVTVSGDLGAVLSTATGTVTAKATREVFPASARQLFTVQRIGGSWKLLHYMFQEVSKEGA